MFTVLRRFAIAMTMGLEYLILGYVDFQCFLCFSISFLPMFLFLRVVATDAVRFSVFLMIAGSVVAAIYDLTFDAIGYVVGNKSSGRLREHYLDRWSNSTAIGLI